MDNINAYLANGVTRTSPENVDKIILYANTSFNRPGKDYLESQKAIYEERLASGEYEGGCEMPGPNNYWSGLGISYHAVNLFYDTTTHNVYINENFPEKRIDAMIVLSCEAFKILCPNSSEENKAWFIENIYRVISSFIRE